MRLISASKSVPLPEKRYLCPAVAEVSDNVVM